MPMKRLTALLILCLVTAIGLSGLTQAEQPKSEANDTVRELIDGDFCGTQERFSVACLPDGRPV